ncbi:DEAD/DEAH box helicase [Streptomyces hirsutus]|uniref:DEAD/DEAH box helicase n=1 Tax=Streptomyces hirsutus TaxID=35620 RepID=UPI0006E304DD|nr:DEAD/DEAH box helicase [Streptomyces hirsutus]
MDVFELHRKLVADYRQFTESFVGIRDPRIREAVERDLAEGGQWPDAWLSINPLFEPGGSVDELVKRQLLHPECSKIFRTGKDAEGSPGVPISFHRHQREAIEVATTGRSFVLTTGTGSGKSLGYIVPIVDHILRARAAGDTERRTRAVIVYPMNALANSQRKELEKFLQAGYGPGASPVTFARYTGQDSEQERHRILRDRPDIILTNYVMLDLLLTRDKERGSFLNATRDLRFLVLDELHTYRGRQGADVALLVRRVRDACEARSLQCIGTSATMSNEGDHLERRKDVARVASRIFGGPEDVAPEHVIGETLRRATRGPDPSPAQLTEAVLRAPDRLTRGYDDLAEDPLAVWIENTFGLQDQAGHLERQRPITLADAAVGLAAMVNLDEDTCRAAIEDMLRAGAKAKDPDTHRPLFAFRLHQFVSKGDTVYVSLEPEATRYATRRYQRVVQGDRGKLLLPLSFCRECGQEYLAVSRTMRAGQVAYEPRHDHDSDDDQTADGYLYVSTAAPWPADPVANGRLPDSWLVRDESGIHVTDNRRRYLPVPVTLALDGTEMGYGGAESESSAAGDHGTEPADDAEGLRAAFVPAPFLFCLNPECKVSYEQVRGRDFAKLASLDSEGRSSAMTVISASIVRSLRSQPPGEEMPREAQKLLTFVDNRQDASLQAGHFNDFVQVTHLRGALVKALSAAGPAGLRYDTLAQRVTDALALPVESYAGRTEVRFSHQRENVTSALRAVVELLLYQDLQGSWRVTMPGLEQTGLLVFDYPALGEIAAAEDLWESGHAALADAAPEQREQLLRLVLDEMRRNLAVDVEVLSRTGFERVRSRSDQWLTGPWALSESHPEPRPAAVFPTPARPGGYRSDVHFTGRSMLGRYLRAPSCFPHLSDRLTVDDAQLVIRRLLEVLCEADLITESVPRSETGTPGYRVKASSLLWLPSDGSAGMRDLLRRRHGGTAPRVNAFFRGLYADLAHSLAGLQAAEHTAQVPTPVREEREARFSSGRLPLLYCSPTMELGVDIKSLNTVAMRNVPPTPANYAQRSGRAGRSGEPALVTTYCAIGNAHDQYYFRRSHLMVQGRVAPPRLDLANEDLVRSHIQAIWLAETGADLHSSLPEVLDLADSMRGYPVREEIWAQMLDPAPARRAEERARNVLASVPDLDSSSWWSPRWLEDVVRNAARGFDRACDRWRNLYRGALAEQEEQNRRVLDQSLSPQSREQAARRRREAENQLKLLRSEDSQRLGHNFSDFYTYRYFASEGFLPGYSFPRLPLAAYIPGSRKARGAGAEGDYLQRPRFLAINEFGPGALIYHEGARYEVKRVQLPIAEPGEIDTEAARLCRHCGYFHEQQAGTDLCDNCGEALTGLIPNLMRLTTVITERRERISSDEEERRRAGFELETAYRFNAHGDRPARLDAQILRDGQKLADLAYGDTASLRVINKGRRRRKEKARVGYRIDTATGRWLPDKQAEALESDGGESFADADVSRPVVPFVEDRRNILLLRLAEPVDEITATTLRFAIERGVEAAFQLEDSELTSIALPDPDNRARMLFTESAEGGAGVLRRLQAEPDALATAAAEALRIVHTDPDTGEDVPAAAGLPEPCELGCYDCLLSYGNQSEHRLIDRTKVIGLLRSITRATVRGTGGAASPADRLIMLKEDSESELERAFLDFLADRELRVPDEAQVPLIQLAARPDFVYRLAGADVAVFVDGPHHDRPTQQQRDEEAEDRLMDAGWLVVRFGHTDNWQKIVNRYPNVFGSGGAR